MIQWFKQIRRDRETLQRYRTYIREYETWLGHEFPDVKAVLRNLTGEAEPEGRQYTVDISVLRERLRASATRRTKNERGVSAQTTTKEPRQ